MIGETPPPTNGESELSTACKTDDAIRLSIPATLLLERRMISRSFWSLPSWYLHAVATGEHLVAGDASTGGDGMAAGKTDKGDLFAWNGFEVTLYKDACERYWHALIGDKPLVYVICRDADDDSDNSDANAMNLRPVLVTVDYDDASAAAETDSPVLSAPIPGELYRYMEKFVLTHYQPREFKKRKRRNWSDEQSQGRRRGKGNMGSGPTGSGNE